LHGGVVVLLLHDGVGVNHALCAISKFKISSQPRYVQTAAENCRGVGAFLCVVLGPDSGPTMCEMHLYKTLDPTPFSSTERYPSALGVRHAVAPYPVLLRSAPVVLGHVPR
jgi:hypothetical protein